MKKVIVLSVCVLVALSLLAAGAMAEKTPGRSTRFKFMESTPESMFQSAAATTTILGWYQFDTPSGAATKQGWTEKDLTAQLATYWHVDGAAGPPCTPGFTPINGVKSMWCGQWVTTSDPWCGWRTLPGYGNNWDQSLGTNVGNTVNTLTYSIAWDSEPAYDRTYVQWWDEVNGAWVDDSAVNGGLGYYDAFGGPQTESSVSPFGATKVRFHFVSDGLYSDEDGSWDSAWGSVIVDDLAINGGPVEDWEGEACRALQSSDAKWVASVPPGFGLYAALHSAATIVQGPTIVQEDPCLKPLSNLWGFYDDPSVTNYACGGWPNQGAIPYGPNANGLYMDNEVWSPWIPITGVGNQFRLQFLVYRDLRLERSPSQGDGLLFYTWSVRTRDTSTDGYPTPWRGNDLVYYGGHEDWLRTTFDVGAFVRSGDTDIQIALAVVDMCPVWCGGLDDLTGSCHSHAPLFDQVRLVRVNVAGPQWIVRDIDLWQDNFPEEGLVADPDGTGPLNAYARCDMAQDILPGTDPNILPGDSLKVIVADPAGLATDATGGRMGNAVYVFVKVTDRFGTPLAGKNGNAIVSPDNRAYAGDPLVGSLRWPFVPGMAPPGWDAYRMHGVYTPDGSRVRDAFCADLMDLGSGPNGSHYKHANENVPANTGIFEPGDVINYILAAKNTLNQWSYIYRTFNGQGVVKRTNNPNEAIASPMEWSVLPDRGRAPGDQGDILYVDDADDRIVTDDKKAIGGAPVQIYFDGAFKYLGLQNRVDRFDVLGPSSCVGNSLASRVKNIANQMIGDPVEVYQKVIWNSSDLSVGLMGDGSDSWSDTPEKSNDFALCYFFLNNHYDNPGWAFWGDDAGSDWNSTGDIALRGTYMDFVLLNDDQENITGVICPLVVPTVGRPWTPHQFFAFGGCPVINDFDCVNNAGASLRSHLYQANAAAPAAVYQATPNAAGTTARFHLAGFAFEFIRDQGLGALSRENYLRHTLEWFENVVSEPIGIDPVAFANALEDNTPNPFNPTTTIRYSIADRGQVSLKIYNVAGQLVRTLVDEEQAPRAEGFAVPWDGTTNKGEPVASGVYFYQLTAKNFEQTKKMVLLK